MEHENLNKSMENLLNVCKVIYHNFEIDIYDEPWSQGDEFLLFRLNGNYIGRIHKYQLCDVIKNDLLSCGNEHLKDILGI